MHSWGKKWLPILYILLISLVVLLVSFLIGAATNYTELFFACLVSSVFLVLVLLIPLEAYISDLVGNIIWSLFSILGDLFTESERWRSTASKYGGFLRFFLFTLGLAITLYGLFTVVDENLLPCRPFLAEIASAPLDTEVLSKCPFTEPLVVLISGNMSDIPSNARNYPSVLIKYMSLLMDNLYLGVAIVFVSGIPRRLFWGRLMLSIIGGMKESEEDRWSRKQRIRREKQQLLRDLPKTPRPLPSSERKPYHKKVEPSSGSEVEDGVELPAWLEDLWKEPDE